MMPFLLAYLEAGPSVEHDRNAARIAEFIIEKAMSGHFGCFKLVLDLVDGKLRRTAEDETTFESGCILVVAERECESEFSWAA
jgi:hypothetical protein